MKDSFGLMSGYFDGNTETEAEVMPSLLIAKENKLRGRRTRKGDTREKSQLQWACEVGADRVWLARGMILLLPMLAVWP